MKNSVCLILVDGMRPDAAAQCGHPFIGKLEQTAFVNYKAKTVFPSVTLPCHFSLFTSVSPQRHGILTNTYVPMVRPVPSLIDRLADYGRHCAMFYNWEELRDLSHPGSLRRSSFHACDAACCNDAVLAEEAISYIKEYEPDFTFLYLGNTDIVGHSEGWMGQEYRKCVRRAWDLIEKTVKSLPEGCTTIVTADHGGHGYSHGEDIPEDMTIPLFIRTGASKKTAESFSDASILDIAPTIARLLEVPAPAEWKGRNLLQ